MSVKKYYVVKFKEEICLFHINLYSIPIRLRKNIITYETNLARSISPLFIWRIANRTRIFFFFSRIRSRVYATIVPNPIGNSFRRKKRIKGGGAAQQRKEKNGTARSKPFIILWATRQCVSIPLMCNAINDSIYCYVTNKTNKSRKRTIRQRKHAVSDFYVLSWFSNNDRVSPLIQVR